MSPELTLRPLLYGDIGAIARVHRRACLTAYAFMGWSHTEEECRTWYALQRYPEWDWGLIAEVDRAIIAFIAVTGRHLDQLFVDPDHQGRGIGSRLSGEALHRTPTVASLYVFELNVAARRFYERHGFKLRRRFYSRDDQSFELEYEHADPG